MDGSGRRRKKRVMKGGRITSLTGNESAYDFVNLTTYPTIDAALREDPNNVVMFRFIGTELDPGLSDTATVIDRTSPVVSPEADRQPPNRHNVDFGSGQMLLNHVDYETLMNPRARIFVYNTSGRRYGNKDIIHGTTDVNSRGLIGAASIAELNAAFALIRSSAALIRPTSDGSTRWTPTNPPPYPLYPLANTLTGREAEQNAAEWNEWTTWATANPGNARMLLDLLPPRLRHGGARAGSRTLPTRRVQRSAVYNLRRTHRHKY